MTEDDKVERDVTGAGWRLHIMAGTDPPTEVSPIDPAYRAIRDGRNAPPCEASSAGVTFHDGDEEAVGTVRGGR